MKYNKNSNPFLDLMLQKPEQELEDQQLYQDVQDTEDDVNPMDFKFEQPVFDPISYEDSVNTNLQKPELLQGIDTEQDNKEDGGIEPNSKKEEKPSLESLLQEYMSSKGQRQEDLRLAAERDRKQRLLQGLTNAFSQIGTGLASGYANVKMKPIDLGPADAEARARAEQKERLGDLLTQYKIKKAIKPETESAAEEAERLKNEALTAKYKAETEAIEGKAKKEEEKKPTIFEKKLQEKTAEDYIKTQQVAEDSIKQDVQLEDALQSQLKFSKDTHFGTGLLYSDIPFTDKSIFRGLNRDAEQLDAKYKQLGLDKMVKMFSGMSKAVDSDAERLAFEKTTPSIKNDDVTNTQIILGAKAINFRNKIEAKAQQKYLDEKGDLKGYNSPMMGSPTSVIVDKNGNFKLIPSKQLDLAKKNGFMTIDEYANTLIYPNK